MWNQDKPFTSITSGEAEKCIDNIRVTQPYMLHIVTDSGRCLPKL